MHFFLTSSVLNKCMIFLIACLCVMCIFLCQNLRYFSKSKTIDEEKTPKFAFACSKSISIYVMYYCFNCFCINLLYWTCFTELINICVQIVGVTSLVFSWAVIYRLQYQQATYCCVLLRCLICFVWINTRFCGHSSLCIFFFFFL